MEGDVIDLEEGLERAACISNGQWMDLSRVSMSSLITSHHYTDDATNLLSITIDTFVLFRA